MSDLSLDGELWRRWARWGSARTPEWFARAAPPVVGLFVYALAAEPRRNIGENLRRVRGERGALRDAVDVARTFTAYASCLAEVLRAGERRDQLPRVVVHGERHVLDALAAGRGLVMATAHTGGWESVGGLVSRDLGLRVMIVETAERDPGARAIQDEARRAHGVLVAHVGDDPLSALPLARHLREGGAVAFQIDRTPEGQRRRAVRLFGREGFVPEGPLRLASLTGAPIVPVFAARTGHRRYIVRVAAPVWLDRHATEDALDAAAQTLGDALQAFVRERPTQWFHFTPPSR